MDTSQAKIAGTAATAIIEAIQTDGWDRTADLVAEILAESEQDRPAVVADLWSTRLLIIQASPAERGRARIDARDGWAGRILAQLDRAHITADAVEGLTSRIRVIRGGVQGYHARRIDPDRSARCGRFAREAPPGTSFDDANDDLESGDATNDLEPL